MSSKTLKFIKEYKKLLVEQDEEDDFSQEDMGDEQMDVQDVQQPQQEEIPLTSEAEEQYIQDLVDAALYEPSSEDAKILADLQGVIKTKSYGNAREEILPIVLNIIRPSTEGSKLRDELDDVG